MKIRDMVFTALFATVICAVAPFVIILPFSPIPLSLATFIIYIAASSANWKTGTLAVVLYLLIGMIGLPIFSGFQGGVHKLIGPTGGFLLGYIPCAFIVGFLVEKFEKKKWVYPVSMVIGTAVLYAFGTLWFMVSMNYTLAAALMACVVPFLIGDAVKIVLVSVIAPGLRMMHFTK